MRPYIGEIRLFAGSKVPDGWKFCDGSVLPVDGTTDPLFSLIGTTYGGDGINNFALPNLSMQVAVHRNQGVDPGKFGSDTNVGQNLGSKQVAIYDTNLPLHLHSVTPSSKLLTAWSFYSAPKLFAYSENGTKSTPTGNLLAFSGNSDKEYYHNGSLVDMMDEAVDVMYDDFDDRTFHVRSSAADSSIRVLELPMPLYIEINYIICIEGFYPKFL